MPFLNCTENVWDYFQLRNLTSVLVSTKHATDLKICSDFLRKCYGESPAYLAGRVGVNIKGFFGRAKNYAVKLTKLYPKNVSFKGLSAAISAIQGDTKETLRTSFNLLKVGFAADEVQLANWCMLENARSGVKNSSTNLRKFEDCFDTSPQNLSENKCVWMTYVGNADYQFIADNRLDSPDFSLQLPKESKKGDWVLLTKKDGFGGTSRLMGIFEVVEKLNVQVGVSSNAFIEPIHVFEKSIELDMHEVDERENNDLFKSFGISPVFEIDNSGLEIIFDEIEDQLIFDSKVISKIQQEWRRIS